MRHPAIAAIGLVASAACASDGGVDPNAGLLRDFLDGKFDGAGHPLNARITEAEALCPDAPATDGVVALDGPCTGTIDGGAQRGAMVASVRLRVRDPGAAGTGALPIVAFRLTDAAGVPMGEELVTADRLREPDDWIDVAIGFDSAGEAAQLSIVLAEAAAIDLDYVEVFPRQFRLVVSPGSGVIDDSAVLELELAPGAAIDRLVLDDVDLLPRLTELLATGVATRQDTPYRALIAVPVGALAETRADVAQLRVGAGYNGARVELRRAPAPCVYEGDPAATPVLITGFQPFPANSWHDNVSRVGVTALRPDRLRGARVMRMILPVEYDLAAEAVRDAIARCAPAVVISFGQGGGEIALEHTAYNLKDTSEVAGGVPDNRGIIAAALPIEPGAEATRSTSLPIEAIERGLQAIGEDWYRSDDPGRYICNNVFFTEVAAIGPTGRAGFIHLPYTTEFDDLARERWAAVVEAAVNAAVAPD